MKKWITSNYHYMVPEYDETSRIQPDFSAFLADIARGKEQLGSSCATPVIMGPVSLARLTKISTAASGTMNMTAFVQALIPVYADLIQQVAALGFSELQIHEPVLVFAESDLLPLFKLAYPTIIQNVHQKMDINMVSFMDDVGAENYQWLIQQPEIRVISMDFSSERGGKSLDFVAQFGFPATKTLGAGLIDARNVWKVIPEEVGPRLNQLTALVANVRIQPSGSLQYCPWNLEREGEDIKNHPSADVLAFAAQKLNEVALVAQAAHNIGALQGHSSAWKTFHEKRAQFASKHVQETARRIQALTATDFARPESYKERRYKQMVGVPALPTTTIGSFPQTPEIRRLRAQLKKGSISDKEYKAGIDQQIAFCIGIQEAIGLDVFVSQYHLEVLINFFWLLNFGSIFFNDLSSVAGSRRGRAYRHGRVFRSANGGHALYVAWMGSVLWFSLRSSAHLLERHCPSPCHDHA